MEVSEVSGGARGAFEGLHIWGELDQVAGDKAGGEAKVAQDLYQEPCRVAAGTGAQGDGLLAGLHSVFQADHITDFALNALIEANQEVQSGRADARYLREEAGQTRTGDFGFQKRA